MPSNSKIAHVGFSGAPSLVNDGTEDGYSVSDNRVKWDDSIQTMRFTQTWGDKFLNFSKDIEAIQKMQAAGSMMLELKWHSNGNVNFKYPLKGSTAAINEARAKCKSLQLATN